MLHIVAVGSAEAFSPDGFTFVGVPPGRAKENALSMRSAALACQLFGTGPPVGSSFAEAVLQRSLLAHAPPFLA
jgi:hypothetical protein